MCSLPVLSFVFLCYEGAWAEEEGCSASPAVRAQRWLCVWGGVVLRAECRAGVQGTGKEGAGAEPSVETQDHKGEAGTELWENSA